MQGISLSAQGVIFALQVLDKNKPDGDRFFLTLIGHQSISNRWWYIKSFIDKRIVKLKNSTYFWTINSQASRMDDNEAG